MLSAIATRADLAVSHTDRNWYLQLSKSKESKNGGALNSAVCGWKLILISAPEPYEHRECARLLFFYQPGTFPLAHTYTHHPLLHEHFQQAVYGWKWIPISAPEPCEHRECCGVLVFISHAHFLLFSQVCRAQSSFMFQNGQIGFLMGATLDFFWLWHSFKHCQLVDFQNGRGQCDLRQCFQVFDMQIHKYKYTNTQIQLRPKLQICRLVLQNQVLSFYGRPNISDSSKYSIVKHVWPFF